MEGSFIKHIHIKTYKDTHITAEKQVEPFYNHPASSKDLFIGTRGGLKVISIVIITEFDHICSQLLQNPWEVLLVSVSISNIVNTDPYCTDC